MTSETTMVKQYAGGCRGAQLLLLMQSTGCGHKMADRGYSEAVSIEMVVVYMLLAGTSLFSVIFSPFP